MNKGKKILLFLVLLIGMVIFPYIPLELFHINLDNLSEKFKITYNFICDIGYVIIIFLIYMRENISEFEDYFKNIKKYFKISISYYVIGFILMYMFNILIATFFSKASANNDIAVKHLFDMYPAYMLFSTLIYAPIVEETIFRRSIKDVVLAYGDNLFTKYVYIIISGLLFALMHIIGIATSSYDYLYILPYLSFGICFAILYYKTNNLYTTITLHLIHNFITILLYLVTGV